MGMSSVLWWIMVHAMTLEVGLEWLCSVFTRLREARLKLSPKKCRLFKTWDVFLDHVVSEEGVSTDSEKIKAICEWPTPTSASALHKKLNVTLHSTKQVLSQAPSPYEVWLTVLCNGEGIVTAFRLFQHHVYGRHQNAERPLRTDVADELQEPWRPDGNMEKHPRHTWPGMQLQTLSTARRKKREKSFDHWDPGPCFLSSLMKTRRNGISTYLFYLLFHSRQVHWLLTEWNDVG